MPFDVTLESKNKD